ncbi:hypothetical protein [Sphingomonas sp. KR3-1]|uniref:hypothetical protein n=1 Tax=Sphingomonas sp. KR3-1 TaxID=3156611 RepID=UPI0032B446BE
MTLVSIALLAKWSILGWFAALLLLVAYRIMTDKIVIDCITCNPGSRSFSFHRGQLLLITICFAAIYVLIALSQPVGKGLPDIPTPLLAALLGSHIAFIGGKLLSR